MPARLTTLRLLLQTSAMRLPQLKNHRLRSLLNLYGAPPVLDDGDSKAILHLIS